MYGMDGINHHQNLEVFWSTMMKWSDGFSKINYSLHSDWNDC